MSDPGNSAPPTRQQLIDERLRRARQELEARAALVDPGVAAARVAAVSAETLPVESSPIGKRLPLAARIAMAGPERMINAPIHEPDLENFKGLAFDADAWLRVVDEKLREYDFGNVHHSTVVLACRELAAAATGGRGMARWTYELWASFARCGRSTIHKIIRALWDTELVRIFNPYYWQGREQRRAANAYFPTMPPGHGAEAVAEAPTPPESTAPGAEAMPPAGAVKAMRRMAAAVRELASYFPGLHARTYGLNTSPLRQEPRQERRTAPT